MFLHLEAEAMWIPLMTDSRGFSVEVEVGVEKLIFFLPRQRGDDGEFCRLGQRSANCHDIACGVFFPAKLEILFKAEGQESFGHSGIVVRFSELGQSLSIFRNLMEQYLWGWPSFQVL